ncbi:MAG: hypothetical protein ACK41O_09565 [Runella zeae]
MKTTLNNWTLWLIVSLTLGLAPFWPEPHLVGKIRWIAGGAVGMKPIDWFDFMLHGAPWVLLLRAVFVALQKNKKRI